MNRVASRLRHPRTTVRWRLTLLYGGLFLVCGAGLLAITYALVEHAAVKQGPPHIAVQSQGVAGPTVKFRQAPPLGDTPTFQRTLSGARQLAVPPQLARALTSSAGKEVIRVVGTTQRIADMHQLVIESAIALAIMAILSGALGWVVAGRVLRPLRTMTVATQEISAANLHERLAMEGPRDELRQLADTIDGLLQRLEGAFEAQRRFVANASHELRTPLTAARAMLEMALTDPRANLETFRTTCRQVLEESEHQEELIDALLTLAQGQRGIDQPARFDLAEIAERVVRAHEAEAVARDLHLHLTREPAPVDGDARLAERLLSNLVENALRHNITEGRVDVRVGGDHGRAVLTVSNTGPLVPDDEVPRLLQPFQRLAPGRVHLAGGLGLGLSIVAAIADAHNAALDVRPVRTGGLDVEVRFPPARSTVALPAAVAPGELPRIGSVTSG